MTTPYLWQAIHDELGVSQPDFDDRPMGAFIEEHAKNIPDNIALRFFSRSFSYRELNALVNRLANVLVDLGIGKGDVVGIHMPNVPQYLITLLAVSKVGAAASGISLMAVPSELSYQLEDSNISVLVSLDSLAENVLAKINPVPACLKHVLIAGSNDYLAPQALTLPLVEGVNCVAYLDAVSAANDKFNQQATHYNDTYLMQYTGGTTGRPKGAMLSIRTVNHVHSSGNVYDPMAVGQEIALSPFPMFHVAGVSFHTACIRYGAQCVLIPDPRDVDHLLEELMVAPITRFAAVPTLYQMLISHENITKVDFSQLRTAVTGAAPLAGREREKIEKVIGLNKLTDNFGMTETGPTYISNPPGRVKAAALGVPLPGADVRIVDVETGTKIMPVGEPGEIITAGPHVMKGYLHLPEESANAMREFDGKVFMYTGDVGYFDDEGYLYISDRAKDMLIVGGFKVFSVELEDKMSKMGIIERTAVIGTADKKRPGNDVVNLYVELRPAAKALDQAQIKSDIMVFCRENMSAYKVPKAIHIIDQIPLTAVGKIDKKALRR